MNYDIPEIEPLDRFGFYAALGLVRVMEPHTELLMMERAEKERVGDEYDSPHSRPWFVSFHGSEFPGVEADACQRYLLYRMLNIPKTEAMPPWVTTTGTIGKAGELDIADAWFQGGRMLAIPEDPEIKWARVMAYFDALDRGNYEAAQEHRERTDIHQLGFVDPDVWMTVSTDLPTLPPGWRRPHIVEVKGKADEVLEEMINGRMVQKMEMVDGKPVPKLEMVGRKADPAHTNQLDATIGLAHEYDWGEVTVCSGCWRLIFADIFERLAGQRMNPAISAERAAEDNLRFCPWCGHEGDETFTLEPPTTGEIYYWSRSWPRKTKSFYREYNPDFIAAGREQLAQAREHFINDTIPPRPDHFQWSLGACKFCFAKPFCREDAGVPGRLRKPRTELIRTTLTESAGVDFAKTVRPGYDVDAVRARVFKEWETR